MNHECVVICKILILFSKQISTSHDSADSCEVDRKRTGEKMQDRRSDVIETTLSRFPPMISTLIIISDGLLGLDSSSNYYSAS